MQEFIEIDTSNEVILSESEIAQTAVSLITNGVSENVLAVLTTKAESIVVKDWQDEVSVKAAKELKSTLKSLVDKLNRRRIDVKKSIEGSAQEVIQKFEAPLKYLDTQIAVRTDEVERQKREEEKRIQGIIDQRSALIKEQGGDVELYFLHPEACDDVKFEKYLNEAINNRKLREESEAREKAERERLEAERIAKDVEIEQLKKQLAEKEVPKEVPQAVQTIVAALDNQEPSEDTFRIMQVLQRYPTEVAKARRIIELEDKLSGFNSISGASF